MLSIAWWLLSQVSPLAGKLSRLLELRFFSVCLSLCCSGKCVGNNMHSLNLSGTNIEKLPDDLLKCMPKLKSLKLNECRALVFLPLSLAALKEIEVDHCSSLVYPPSSARATPQKVLQFLRDVDPTSEPWRRLKVECMSHLPQHILSAASL